MNPKIYIISGKARHGKDTIANMIQEYYQEKNKKLIVLHYASTLKEYAKKIADWDGSDNNKPRQLLQQLSTEIIRKQIDPDFFVNRMIEDIKVYSYFYDAMAIADSRMKKELTEPIKNFDQVITIRVTRPNFDNGLTEEQKKHITEIDLDDYKDFDYYIENDGTLEDLKIKVNNLIDKIEGE